MSRAWSTLCYAAKIDDESFSWNDIAVYGEDVLNMHSPSASEVIGRLGGRLICEDHCGGWGVYIALQDRVFRTDGTLASSLKIPNDAMKLDGSEVTRIRDILHRLDIPKTKVLGCQWWLIQEYEAT